MSTYVVGDIHGCIGGLREILRRAGFRPDRDILWLVGDVVGRGPESLTTLRFLHERRDNIRLVLGNHDIYFLAAHHRPELRVTDTLDALLEAPDCPRLARWLAEQPIIHRQDGWVMVHAGIPPHWDTETACRKAAELERALDEENIRDFLPHLYGNMPNVWEEGLPEMEKLRLICNYFTRMRFCSARGELAFIGLGNEEEEKMAPWFSHPRQAHNAGEKILFGHWSALGGDTGEYEHAFAMDAGYVWGRELKMMRLEDREVFRLKSRKAPH